MTRGVPGFKIQYSISHVLYRLKSRSSGGAGEGGRLKCYQCDTSWIWYYVWDVVGWPQLLYIRGVVDSAAGSNRRNPSYSREGRIPISKFFWNREIFFVKDQSCQAIPGCWVMLQLKIGSARRVSHHTAYMGDCY